LLIIVVGNALLGELRSPYGGYDVRALLLFGGGGLLATLVAAIILAARPWKPERLRREHEPGEDHLLT
jgi:NSS family neurotransmitter:Na+ symporter